MEKWTTELELEWLKSLNRKTIGKVKQAYELRTEWGDVDPKPVMKYLGKFKKDFKKEMALR